MVEANEIIFVFEVCCNCHTHQTHTRHNEARYKQYFDETSAAIMEEIPNAVCLLNQVPKNWHAHDLYSQLIPNEDEGEPNFDMIPIIGAFEVSTVIHNTPIQFFSKLKLSYWPRAPAVAARIKQCFD